MARIARINVSEWKFDWNTIERVKLVDLCVGKFSSRISVARKQTNFENRADRYLSWRLFAMTMISKSFPIVNWNNRFVFGSRRIRFVSAGSSRFFRRLDLFLAAYNLRRYTWKKPTGINRLTVSVGWERWLVPLESMTHDLQKSSLERESSTQEIKRE